ncbi:unnamed protein product [Symbiodinium necroappetens]|uniref:Methyltransferase FkbM domain-containing protein n=1 Tax=Symbiodinium necroappetens TaxID=1628268 RepID=A0A812MGB2_9DINO|nr:unnamed protein product [Symbiodinium necroappetens]
MVHAVSDAIRSGWSSSSRHPGFLLSLVVATSGPVLGRLSIDDGHLVITTPVAKLQDGDQPLLDIPLRANILIDVGTHRESTFLPRLRSDPAAWVIAFEPDYLHWAHHLVNHAHPRMILINAAVGNSSRGWSTLYRWAYSGEEWRFNSGGKTQLGSLLQADPNRQLTAHETMQVAVVSLKDILAVLPDRVQILKTDVQGADLEVVKSAGTELKRVDRIVIEIPDDTPRPVYSGQHTRKETEDYLAHLGFRHERCWAISGAEHDCAFARSEAWIDLPSEAECFPSNRTLRLFDLWQGIIDYTCSTNQYPCERNPRPQVKMRWIEYFCCGKLLSKYICFGRRRRPSYETCCLAPYLTSIGYPNPEVIAGVIAPFLY